MPQTTEEYAWWVFNLAILGLLWFVRKDLKQIRDDIKQSQRVNNWLRHVVIGMYSRCQHIHPEKPIFPMPEDPDSH